MKKHLLLFEDDKILCQEISTFLRKNEMTCDIFQDGSEVLQKLTTTNHYDLIILDINVPKINGIAVCKHIRTLHPNVPIVMLTALGEIHDKVEAFNAGADDYIVKPFSPKVCFCMWVYVGLFVEHIYIYIYIYIIYKSV